MKEQELANGMDVITEKSKIIKNSTTDTIADITMNVEKLEKLTSFKYLAQSLLRMVPVPLRSE
ncbi:hypothetical protein DPMN_146310 [Dreissena polymorpha]|uniref:Uncharacterized protein n=1 Tax=Dreissena polymorpha TaxID=45954 RepID=A0A9D4F7N6_DREPO|nr:hypothetical protein DPMN_146310 [Dreissena polymorpha]